MPAERDLIDTLTKSLARVCRALADAGQAHDAGRLAAEAWAALRGGHPIQARQLDGVMHYAARLDQHQDGTTLMADDQVLDVRSEAPKRRHELIFETFAELEPGAAYVLVNDHDPKPLRYQFDAELRGQFSWEDLEDGPHVWRVRIGRTAETKDRAEVART